MSKAPVKNDIELQLSETHFFQLLDLIYLGNWMVTACSGVEDEHAQEYTDVEKQMFSHAEPFLEKGPFHTLNSEVIFTEEHEDSLQDIIGEYDNEVFWEALAYRMAKRDVIEQIGPIKEIKNEVFMQIFHREMDYIREFETNGIKRITIPPLQ